MRALTCVYESETWSSRCICCGLQISGSAVLFSTCFLTLEMYVVLFAEVWPHPVWELIQTDSDGCTSWMTEYGDRSFRLLWPHQRTSCDEVHNRLLPFPLSFWLSLKLRPSLPLHVFNASRIFVLPLLFRSSPPQSFFFFSLFVMAKTTAEGGRATAKDPGFCTWGTRSTRWVMRHPQSYLFFLHSIHSSLFPSPRPLFRLADVSLRRCMCAPD